MVVHTECASCVQSHLRQHRSLDGDVQSAIWSFSESALQTVRNRCFSPAVSATIRGRDDRLVLRDSLALFPQPRSALGLSRPPRRLSRSEIGEPSQSLTTLNSEALSLSNLISHQQYKPARGNQGAYPREHPGSRGCRFYNLVSVLQTVYRGQSNQWGH